MCTTSMIGDHYSDKWRYFQNVPHQPFPAPLGGLGGLQQFAQPSRAEFDALKAEVENMKALLVKAKAYDEATGQADCEMEEKVAILRKVAEFVGVDLAAVFGKPAEQ